MKKTKHRSTHNMLRQEIHAFLDKLKRSILTLQSSIKSMSHTLNKVKLTLNPILLQLRKGPLGNLGVHNHIRRPLNEARRGEAGFLQQVLRIHTIILILSDDCVKLGSLPHGSDEIRLAWCAQIESLGTEWKRCRGWWRDFVEDLVDELGRGESGCTRLGMYAQILVIEGITEVLEPKEI